MAWVTSLEVRFCDNRMIILMHSIALTLPILFVQAMIARGFRGDPSNHKIYFLTESSFGFADLFSLLCLFALMGLASYSDQLVWWYQKGFSIMHEVSIVLILSCTHINLLATSSLFQGHIGIIMRTSFLGIARHG